MAAYTCIACQVLFQDADIQREHYKTDWHRYNLKRKIVELQPVTEEEFQQKVNFQAQKKEEKLNSGKSSTACQTCNKKFSSEKAYENHIKSNKHKELLAKQSKDSTEDISSSNKEESGKPKKSLVRPKRGYMPPMEDSEVKADDSDEWEDIEEEEMSGSDMEEEDDESEALPQTTCLFCPHQSVSVEDNMRHMSKSHCFFIPDLDFVTDLEAFLIYLGAKVGDGKICLRCNIHSRQFRTIQACQEHMLDKGHCMIDYEGDAILEYSDFYDFSSTYPDHENNTDMDSEISPYENAVSIDPTTLELVLPSGARAGHRALNKYYKQNILPEKIQRKNHAMITGVNTRYRALGLTGATLTVATRKRIEAKKVEIKTRAYHRMRLGVKANLLQHHFRKQFAYCG